MNAAYLKAISTRDLWSGGGIYLNRFTKHEDGRIVQTDKAWALDALDGELFFVEPRMCRLLSSAASHFPVESILTEPMIFSPRGTVVFGEPLPWPRGQTLPGLVWARTGAEVRFAGIEPGSNYRSITGELDKDVLVRDMLNARLPEVADAIQSHIGENWRESLVDLLGDRCVMETCTYWRIGEQLSETFIDHQRSLMREGVPDDHDSSDASDTREDIEALSRSFSSLLAFITQRLPLIERRPVEADRAARRRYMRERGVEIPADILVIDLRRKESPHHIEPANHDAVDWRCQWEVVGHWRRQWLPSTQTHADPPIWIAPYVKGPPDKPFRTKGRIFTVVR